MLGCDFTTRYAHCRVTQQEQEDSNVFTDIVIKYFELQNCHNEIIKVNILYI